MYEFAGNMHVHTRYSDGEKWHAEVIDEAIAAGLDFIIFTDHNIYVEGIEGYHETERGRLLVLVGEEVHNVRRRPQASHFLAYGAGKELATFADDPQRLIDETREAGGFGFLAHPHEKELAVINSEDLGWHDWDIEGFHGFEIWNYMSGFKNDVYRRLQRLPIKSHLVQRLVGLWMVLHPERYVFGAEAETLALWDQHLASGARMSAVGNSDAHATPMRVGPIGREVFPYEFLFRAVNTHVLLEQPLSGDLEYDRRRIIQAIGDGISWVGYDLPRSTKGFRFTVQGNRKGHVGSEMSLGVGATLQVSAPARCHIRLIRHGETVAEAEAATNLTHIPVEPGAYRVECYIDFEKRPRGWIYSNPIYLR